MTALKAGCGKQSRSRLLSCSCKAGEAMNFEEFLYGFPEELVHLQQTDCYAADVHILIFIYKQGEPALVVYEYRIPAEAAL